MGPLGSAGHCITGAASTLDAEHMKHTVAGIEAVLSEGRGAFRGKYKAAPASQRAASTADEGLPFILKRSSETRHGGRAAEYSRRPTLEIATCP